MPTSKNRRKGKKKPKSSARKSQSRESVPQSSAPLVATESVFHLMGLGSMNQSDDQRRAQEMVYEAWERAYPRDRVKLAKQALELWPDCADAWVILAENTATTLDEAEDLYTAAVEAGERALGEDAFTEDVGHFWGIHETRPYMRARLGLARLLKEMGRVEEAVEHLRDMLRLNPGDNQGNRYVLLHLLLEHGRDEEATRLLEEYPDDGMAEWTYARALLAFRQHGASQRTDELLAAALDCNQFVPAYLLGRRRIPKQLPEMIGLGDNNEAIACAVDYKAIWRNTPGALDWLKSNL